MMTKWPNVLPELQDTAADPRIQRMTRAPVQELCCEILGKWPHSGYQFQDNDNQARCAFPKPCPYHNPKTTKVDDD